MIRVNAINSIFIRTHREAGKACFMPWRMNSRTSGSQSVDSLKNAHLTEVKEGHTLKKKLEKELQRWSQDEADLRAKKNHVTTTRKERTSVSMIAVITERTHNRHQRTQSPNSCVPNVFPYIVFTTSSKKVNSNYQYITGEA
eukprot:GHVU01128271.1.p1 GENE.GHVU01128271.1~~GHVU01128271.1.p1  ORF type:complete len:142 (+),score=18.11 GHVU01128271.1:1308-1733(+)